MNFRKIDGSPKTFILVFQTGDELAVGLLQFAYAARAQNHSSQRHTWTPPAYTRGHRNGPISRPAHQGNNENSGHFRCRSQGPLLPCSRRFA
jgi:hypothetical protein